jgi:hypothetical protein
VHINKWFHDKLTRLTNQIKRKSFWLTGPENFRLHLVFIINRLCIAHRKGLHLLPKNKLTSKWRSNSAKRRSCVDLWGNFGMKIPHMGLRSVRLNLTFKKDNPCSPRVQNKIKPKDTLITLITTKTTPRISMKVLLILKKVV